MRSLLKKYLSVEMRNKIRWMLPAFVLRKMSYSQSGEDIIVSFLLDIISGARPRRYLDIGANHPFFLSNTALLYKNGGSGILVEPDPFFANLLRRKRPRDQVIQSGVHFSGESNAEFYIMDSPTLNTFSKQEMLRYVAMGHKLTNKINVELLNVNKILEMAGELDFLNLDIEGLDFSVLEMIDWEKHRPKCVCVESISYEKNKEPKKLVNITNLMLSRDYILYADTFINSIFVDRHQWESHWSQTKSI